MRGTQMAIDLDELSLAELKKLEKDVAKAIKGFEARQRAEALNAAEAAAREAGFSLSELMGGMKGASKPKASPKYRHPENPSLTWSGRGRQPAWFKEAIASGTETQQLLIG